MTFKFIHKQSFSIHVKALGTSTVTLTLILEEAMRMLRQFYILEALGIMEHHILPIGSCPYSCW